MSTPRFASFAPQDVKPLPRRYLPKWRAARRLGVSVPELNQQIEAGQIPTLELVGVEDDTSGPSRSYRYYVRNNLIHTLDSSQHPLSMRDVLVLLTASIHCDVQGTFNTPQLTLARRSRTNKKTVERSLAYLVKLGLLQEVHRPKRGAKNREANTYRFSPMFDVQN